ncbi:hypothetical protein QMO56_04500 [Roseomonas sp. E05]|uniref:hypothetical protein n=1 Tax=Roseomonas sp. E05 TaxID=3046310 RepID=UPI0024B9F679|nr:hypothetical protein [Roseomonas sp. E05]MDJ0387364.1 hypothetical protein [Roseomonas sp. E05]
MSGGEGRGVAPSFRFHAAEEADFERLLDLSSRTLRTDLARLGRWGPARRRARMRESSTPPPRGASRTRLAACWAA